MARLPAAPSRKAGSAPATPRTEAAAAEPFDVRERARNQRLNIIEGTLTAGSTGLTADFVVPFGIALGAGNTLIALLSTLPSLIGSIAQLSAQRLRALFDTRRKYMAVFTLLQAICWLPLLAVPALPHPGAWLLGIMVVNAVLGFLVGPVWNSFTADIVPELERGRFFGLRNTCTGVVAFISTLGAGLMLDAVKPTHPLLGFALLFVLAFVLRAGAAWLFTKMGKPPEAKERTEMPAPHELLLHANRTPFGRFTLFLVLLYIGVYISTPFFAIYQLQVLHMSYTIFTLLAATAAVASFVTMFLWGRYVDSWGSSRIMFLTGMLIPVFPFIFALTTDLRMFFVAEVISGMAWAGFNLSASTYLFDATDRERRTRQVAEYTLLIQMAAFLGAMLGSWILKGFGDDAIAYRGIFMLSGVLRIAAVLGFARVIREQRLVEIPVRGRVFRRFVTVRPTQGIVYEPAVESHRHHPGSPTVRDLKERFSGTPRKPGSIDKLAASQDTQHMQSYEQQRTRRPRH